MTLKQLNIGFGLIKHLSVVKDNHIVGKKWPEMVVKWPFILSDSFPIRVYHFMYIKHLLGKLI